MEELIKINQSFNNELDSSFSLTKMFKKGNLLMETVNKILTVSLCIGALSQMPTVIEHLEPASMNHALEVETKSLYSDSIKINKENIKSLSDSGMDNIYQSYNQDQLIVTAVGNKFTSEDPVKEALSNKLLKINSKPLTGNYASHGGYDINKIRPLSEMMRFNFEEPDKTSISFMVLDPEVFEYDVNFQKNYPTLFKHKSLFVFAHELNHITNAQTVYANNASNDNIIPIEVAKETSSDIFGAIVVMQSENLSHSESIELLDDLIKFRLNSHHMHGDLDHATYSGLSKLKNIIEVNPEIIEQLKMLDLEKLDEVVMGFSSELYSNMINKKIPEEVEDSAKFILMSSLNIDLNDSQLVKNFKKDLNIKVDQSQSNSQKSGVLAKLKKDSEDFNPNKSTIDNQKMALSGKYK